MDDSDDDLHGRQLLVLLAFFGTVGDGLYLIGWLTRPSFLYGNPLVCPVIAGGACYPARFLSEGSRGGVASSNFVRSAGNSC